MRHQASLAASLAAAAAFATISPGAAVDGRAKEVLIGCAGLAAFVFLAAAVQSRTGPQVLRAVAAAAFAVAGAVHVGFILPGDASGDLAFQDWRGHLVWPAASLVGWLAVAAAWNGPQRVLAAVAAAVSVAALLVGIAFVGEELPVAQAAVARWTFRSLDLATAVLVFGWTAVAWRGMDKQGARPIPSL